jgi:hypothetical protein
MCNTLRRLKQISFKWTVKPVVCIFAETGPDEGDGRGRQASLYFLNVGSISTSSEPLLSLERFF